MTKIDENGKNGFCSIKWSKKVSKMGKNRSLEGGRESKKCQNEPKMVKKGAWEAREFVWELLGELKRGQNWPKGGFLELARGILGVFGGFDGGLEKGCF